MDFTKAPPVGTIELIVITAIITTLIGVFGKKIIESTIDKVASFFSCFFEYLYHWIAPRNPMSIALWSYKKHVMRSNLTKIENPVGPSLSVPLEHAFAPLKLVSDDLQQTIDLFTHVANKYRSIVLGGPGTGKTTLMKSLVTSVVNDRCIAELNQLIPVFIVLRNLVRKEHSVKDAIVCALADHHFPGATKFVESAISQGKLLIILDGLDEVGANRGFAVNQILQFCEFDDQQNKKNRLLVTCREHAYLTKDLHSSIQDIVRVEPFANHHMRVFLKGWPEHKGRSAVNLYSLIQSDPQIRDICRNPLLLTILTGLYLDDEDFKIPTSRNQFYKCALDELLINRPTRRQIVQDFHHDDKRQLLERAALERLETAQAGEDIEELTLGVIYNKAKEIITSDKFDVRALIKEMIEINGIIRPSREDNYTFAHRTIQEYLAAREARRTRTSDEVANCFGNKTDLIEVLYFYCGLLNNIPALTGIIQKFSDDKDWIKAGRCLLNAREIVKPALIKEITEGLSDKISRHTDYNEYLVVLASLSQRNEKAFDNAKYLFSNSIDYLSSKGERGASALESALSASPDLAMKVIPSLLQHQSERWKIAAVQLFRDIGTDEALDRLVQLLQSNDIVVRQHTGFLLAGMLGHRNKELIQRATLLPERIDQFIWPLNSYFPSRLAIPIAESIVNMDKDILRNMTMQYAAEAIRIKNKLPKSLPSKIMRYWVNLRRDISIRLFCQKTKRILDQVALAVTFTMIFILISTIFFSYFKSSAIVINFSTASFYTLDNVLIDRVKTKSANLIGVIEKEYPPNASGIERILPWNWDVEPKLPIDQTQAFEIVKNLKYSRDLSNSLSQFELTTSSLVNIQILSSGLYSDLYNSVKELTNHLPKLIINKFILIPPVDLWSIISILLFCFYYFWMAYYKRFKIMRDKYSYYMNFILFFQTLFFYLLLVTSFNFALICSILILIVNFMPTLLGSILVKLPWANNPLTKEVSEVLELKL